MHMRLLCFCFGLVVLCSLLDSCNPFAHILRIGGRSTGANAIVWLLQCQQSHSRSIFRTIPWQTSKCRQLVQTCSSVQKCYPYVFESVYLIGLSMLILEQKSYMIPRKKINAFITDAETDVLFSRDPQRFMRKCKRLGVMDTYLTVINDNFS